MRLLALPLVASVLLGAGFGAATAEVEELTEDSMIVSIEVEVGVSASAVVAHLTFDDDPVVTIPLLDRGDGRFGTRTELEPKNYIIVFEAVGTPGELSDPVSLANLGADLSQLSEGSGGSGSQDEEGLSAETQRMGWLALALGAASLSALAFWALGDRDKEDAEQESETEAPDSAAPTE